MNTPHEAISDQYSDDDFYAIRPYSMQECGLSYQLVQKFIARNPGDMAAERRDFSLSKEKHSIYSISDKIKSCLIDARAVMPFNEGAIVITGSYNKHPVFIWVNITHRPEAMVIRVDITAHPEAAINISKFLDRSFKSDHMPIVKWWYQGRHGVETQDVYLPKQTNIIRPEFYPDLGDPIKYLADYMNSDESILLIAGPPGTGKTTLLRHLIYEYNMQAHVIYDENLMDNDTVFQNFLFTNQSEQNDIMIIEDADTILSSRERDGNKLMSRFLNVSDGLIKLPNKKLVFTTNIVDFGNVDHALLRPGRCFGIMHTRPLNLTEAQAAAKVADLPIPTEKREYTLAELFNQGKRAHIRTMGFGARH